jgi:hypothetical protein
VKNPVVYINFIRMRYKYAITSIVIMTCAVLFNDCKKIEQMTLATPPNITATNPVENAEFANGEKLQIKGQVIDAEDLNTFEITVTDDNTKAIIFKITPNVQGLKTYAIDIPWIMQVNDWVDATMKISTANKRGLKAEKIIHFKYGCKLCNYLPKRLKKYLETNTKIE